MKAFKDKLALELAAVNVWNNACKHAGYDTNSKVFKMYAKSCVLQWFIKLLVRINKKRVFNLSSEQKYKRYVLKQALFCLLFAIGFFAFVWLLPGSVEQQTKYDENVFNQKMQAEVKYRANKMLNSKIKD
jgi:hypothetical protein